MITAETDQHREWSSGPLAPGTYLAIAGTAAFNPTPESVGALWRARIRAKEVEVGPGATVEVDLEPTVN